MLLIESPIDGIGSHPPPDTGRSGLESAQPGRGRSRRLPPARCRRAPRRRDGSWRSSVPILREQPRESTIELSNRGRVVERRKSPIDGPGKEPRSFDAATPRGRRIIAPRSRNLARATSRSEPRDILSGIFPRYRAEHRPCGHPRRESGPAGQLGQGLDTPRAAVGEDDVFILDVEFSPVAAALGQDCRAASASASMFSAEGGIGPKRSTSSLRKSSSRSRLRIRPSLRYSSTFTFGPGT